jgi:hypothetical protein
MSAKKPTWLLIGRDNRVARCYGKLSEICGWGIYVVPHDAVADEILRKVVSFVKKGVPAHLRTLDAFPVAVYVTDIDGFITYFNPACVDFAGREPQIFRDRWCVTWRLYTNDGAFLPHHQCPMAIAIQTRQAVRGITAVAERPDGIRLNFLPFPTPVIGDDGELLAAVNVLVDITAHHEFRQHVRVRGSSQEDRVNKAISTFSIEEIRQLVEEVESEAGRQPPGTID